MLYRSLESLDHRKFAQEDPRGFLKELTGGAILDEIQRVPELVSYLLEGVDRDPRPGRCILTGSENLAVSATVSQSLAGRSAMLTLLPLSLDERQAFPAAPTDLWNCLLSGGYRALVITRLAGAGMSRCWTKGSIPTGCATVPISTRPGPTNRNSSRVSQTLLESAFFFRRGRPKWLGFFQ